jgi:ParB-like chromosome segregation protein Spo0J
MKSVKHQRVHPAAIGRPEPLEIIYRQISELKPDAANPRLHSKKQIRQIADSIKTFGFNVPLLVDADLKLNAGHGRLLACPLVGITEVRRCASIT